MNDPAKFTRSSLTFGAVEEARPLSTDDFCQLMQQARTRYQRGFLAWLKDAKNPQGAEEMGEAVKHIEDAQSEAIARSFWSIASDFFCFLAKGALPPEAKAKPLCMRIDLQIRRLTTGSTSVSEGLMRDMRCFLNHAEIDFIDVNLSTPKTAETSTPQQNPHALETILLRAEAAWRKCCAGNALALSTFKEQADLLSQASQQLGNTDFRRLTQAIFVGAKCLSEDTERNDQLADAFYKELATAMLLIKNAHINLTHLSPDFAHHVDILVARIHTCLVGNLPESTPENASLDELTQQAEEEIRFGKKLKQIQKNIRRLEQGLEKLFTAPEHNEKHQELLLLDTPFTEAIATLKTLKQAGAAVFLGACAEKVRAYAANVQALDEREVSFLAQQIFILNRFLDSLTSQSQDTHFDQFVQTFRVNTPHKKPRLCQENQQNGFVEAELASKKCDLILLLEVLRDAPSDLDKSHDSETLDLHKKLKEALSGMKNDADLLADEKLAERVKALLAALNSGENFAEQIQLSIDFLTPVTPEKSSALATQDLSQTEEIHSKLLAIFNKEAKEILAALTDDAITNGQNDADFLRLAQCSYNRLKEGGEMLALHDLAEAAELIEQTVSRHLHQGFALHPTLIDLLDEAQCVFAAWIDHLETPTKARPDPLPMLRLVQSLQTKSHEEVFPVRNNTPTQTSEQHLKTSEISAPQEYAALSAAPLSTEQRIRISPVLFSIFRDEADHYLVQLHQALERLEENPLRPTASSMIRAARALADHSATVGILSVQQLGHALEAALLRRDGSAENANLEALGVIRQTVAELDLLFYALTQQREQTLPTRLMNDLAALYPPTLDDSELEETPTSLSEEEINEASSLPSILKKTLALSQEITSTLAAWAETPSNTEFIQSLSELFLTLKLNARRIGATDLAELTRSLRSRVEEANNAATGSIELEFVLDINSAFKDIHGIIERLTVGESFVSDAHPSKRTIKVRAELVDCLCDEVGEMSMARLQVENHMGKIKDSLIDFARNVSRLRHELLDIEIQTEINSPKSEELIHFQELTRILEKSVKEAGAIQQRLLKNLDGANAGILTQVQQNRALQEALMSIQKDPLPTSNEPLG